jgi:hypothetical protein
MGNRRRDCQGGLQPGRADVYPAVMTKGDDERAKRLADALRDNLRRRKAQARSETAPTPADQEDGQDGSPPKPL